jgi:peptidoglycan-associated lipoprotein
MNRLKIASYLTLGLVCVTVLSSGCRRKPNSLTYIPGHSRSITNELAKPLDDGSKLAQGDKAIGADMDPNKTGGIPLPDRSKRENYNEDREFFKANTLYFDFDKAAVRKSEQGKVQAVADALKGRAEACVEVEGHCDERGTEEYNRALGEKRALSVREYLINLGISSERIFTISFGEDKPAVNGHTEAAWAKNRRGEFILLTPKK